jgi:hypothetical protein
VALAFAVDKLYFAELHQTRLWGSKTIWNQHSVAQRRSKQMPAIKHMAMCTNNNRRLARFYQLILGMEEVWNVQENSPYPFYVTDGYFNLNCLQIYPALAEEKRDVGINHYGFKVEV